MVGLSALPGGAFFSSEAAALSADGSTIVGESTSGLGSIKEAFRWTSGTGMVGLGGLPVTTSSPFSRAFGVSGDGSIVVGISGDDDDGITAFIWDESHGMRKLKDVVRTELFLDYPLTAAYAISADGTTIVGQGGGGQAWLLHIPEPASLPLLAGALGSLLALRRRAAASPS
jgi:probable HAF family extracellular repeat protein